MPASSQRDIQPGFHPLDGHSSHDPTRRTRLAPSPTGALHLGNARTFVVNWMLARQRGWRIILRIEDLDGPRIKHGAAEDAIATLEWLGLDWDDGPVYQSHDLEPYVNAMSKLAARAHAYPCELTRSQIEAAASAPHTGDGPAESRFPAELRPIIEPRGFTDRYTNWRFVTPDRAVEFVDAFDGPQRFNPAQTVGDFVIWTKRSEPAYQLAVVVDDHRQGVTDVVRGSDLLDSAARQTLLYESLDLSPTPSYTHLPLVTGPDGRRLAKRHGDTRIDAYRSLGCSPERILGLIHRWCSTAPSTNRREPISLSEATERFDLASMSHEPIVFSPEDHAWLLE